MLKPNSLFALFILMWAILFCGCKSKPPKAAEILLGNSKNVFREVGFDMDMNTVKKNETASLVNSAEDYLRYEIKNIEGKSSQYAEIEYHFDHNRLDLITVYQNTANELDIEPLFNDVKLHFNKKYGESKSNKAGWETWAFEDKEGEQGNIEIMLKGVNENGLFGIDIELVKYYKDEQKQAQLIPIIK
jgi:hypothetical protein